MAERFLLELPADPAAVSTVRLFAASLARHHRLTEERVDDVKLGVSEACSALLAGTSSEEGRFRVIVQGDQGSLRFEVRREGGSGPGRIDDLGVEILRSLFADAQVLAGEAVTFSVGFDGPLNG